MFFIIYYSLIYAARNSITITESERLRAQLTRSKRYILDMIRFTVFVNSIAENILGSRALGIRDGVDNHSPPRLLGNRDSLTFH